MTISTGLRRRWIWLTIPIIILLAAVVGPYIYIHVIEGTPPAKLTFASASTTNAPTTMNTTGGSLSPSSSAPATTAPGVIDGSYAVAAGSQAGYRVPEKLFGQNTEAVGRTSNVSGTVVVAGTTVQRADVVVDLKTIKSDQSQRDNQFQVRIMNTATYPTAAFSLTSPIEMGSVPADQVQITVRATGTVTLHGATKPATIDLAARRNGTNLEVNGTIPVTFADYGISNPSLGPASVGDTGSIEFLLILQRAA